MYNVVTPQQSSTLPSMAIDACIVLNITLYEQGVHGKMLCKLQKIYLLHQLSVEQNIVQSKF